MAGPIYGSGFIDLKPALSGGVGGFGSQLTGLLGPIGAKMGALLANPIALAIGAAVGAGLAAVNIGGDFDKAFDTIRVGTGAVGDDLEGLKDDFREVFASVPVAMGPASEAVADLNTRLGLTGQPLQDLATQFLNLSRITGTDVAGSIADVTRLFGDWGIASDDQADALDAVFRASQATGAEVGDISSALVKYGAPLRQIGFGFEESAAMIGKFEKEGVNAELVLGSLRIALGKMARAGEDAPATFQRVVAAIGEAGSASEANALSLELFGARAGPDMAAAIREGRFELGNLFDQVSNGTETINGAAADTDDWRESFTLMANNLKLVVEPIATAVFQGLGTLMGGITTVIQGVRDAMADPSSGLGQTFRTLGTIFGEVKDIIAGIIEILTTLWHEWGDEITLVVSTVFGALKAIIEPILKTVRAVIQTILALIKGDWGGVWNGIKATLKGVWDGMVATVRVPLDAMKLAISTVLGVIKTAWEGIWGGLKGAATTALNAVVTAIKMPINAILGLLEGLINSALRGLQGAINVADVLAGPFINFPDQAFTPVRIPRVHSGGLAEDESLFIVQRGEMVIPQGTTAQLLAALDDLGNLGSGTVLEGATLNFHGTPDQMIRDMSRRVGLEVRLAT